jgi:hypothetical protein
MKKTTLTLVLSCFIATIFAQDKKFFDKVFLLYSQGKRAEARALIDGAAQMPNVPTNAEYWIWKSTLDAEVLREGTTPCTDCLTSSFAAFKKYSELEPSLKQAGETPFNWRTISILYEDFFNLGATAFRNKEYEAALTNFENCVLFSNILTAQKIKLVDTIPFLYAGYAAQNSKNYTAAAKNFSILADRKYAVKEDHDMYKLLLVDYIELKDKANFEKYLSIAQEIMPDEDFTGYKMEFLNKHSSLKDKIEYYKIEDAKNAFNDEDYFYFGGIFSAFSKEEKVKIEADPALKEELHTTAIDAFKKSYNKKTNGLAAFNLGILLYQDFNAKKDIQSDNIKSMQALNTEAASEKDVKKKAALKEKAEAIKKTNTELDGKVMGLANETVVWHEKAVNDLKDKTEKREKNCYKNAINMLANIFAYKADKARGKDLKALDAAEAKFKFYDELGSKL